MVDGVVLAFLIPSDLTVGAADQIKTHGRRHSTAVCINAVLLWWLKPTWRNPLVQSAIAWPHTSSVLPLLLVYTISNRDGRLHSLDAFNCQ